MEAQFTIRDTLPNFEGWLKSYTTAKLGHYSPLHPTGQDTGIASEYFGWDWEPAIYVSHHFAPVKNGSVVFRIRVAEPERLEVRAFAHLTQGAESQDERSERQAELDAYLTEFVRAIRMKWEPVNLTVTELYEQSFRRLEAGEKPIDVFRNFYLPKLPEWEQPKDASQTADIHNAWKSAMSARRKKRNREKG